MKHGTDSTPVAGETARPRYVVGIDLGTTNCAVAYVDTDETAAPVRIFPVLQLVAPGETEARETLPSFHYETAAGELTATAVELPWTGGRRQGGGAAATAAKPPRPAFVGLLAREQGARAPGRLVASAKSWLSHSGVDRQAPLLPWHGAADVTRLSPVEVSASILDHIRAAWDHVFGAHPLAEQDVVVTVPASFDEVARELTVAAARQAGLPRIVLLEEPQAAFYAWIERQGDEWSERMKPGRTILVCDIGGGTTDLTLIEARAGEAGEVRFHRVAVGDHLILGGDNLDLALAHEVERRLDLAEPLTPAIWSILIRRCQRVKELLLSADAPAETTLSLPAGGSRLIAGARQVTLGRDEVRELLLDGFLPRVGAAERPAGRGSGFQEFGLPYAADAAITRYLAEFLARHAAAETAGEPAAGPSRPDAVLLNGGFFASQALRQRLLDTLAGWFEVDGEPSWAPEVLTGGRLDLAVAQGAAYFGRVRRGEGVRIGGGLPRSYYIGIETAGREGRQGLCLLPAGLEEGETVRLEHRFDLRIRQPVEMAVFVSSLRTTDQAGDLIEIDPENLTALPPIRTVLKSGRKSEAEEVPVRLEAHLTEVGTLEIWCREEAGSRSWRLQFDARAATRTDIEAHLGAGERSGFVDDETVARCRQRIAALFATARTARSSTAQAVDPARLVKGLEKDTGMRRQAWPTSLLRAMWESLMAVESGRGLGVAYEARWLHLAGYALRPGYGLALDDWRVATTWRHFLARGPEHPRNEMCRAEWWVFWRRLAGGLSAGQQRALASPILAALRAYEAAASRRAGGSRRQRSRKGAGGKAGGAVDFKGGSHETAEIWRLLGALEWLDAETQQAMGETILSRLGDQGPALWNGAGLWTLGRLGARVPQYGPLNTTLPIEVVESWLPAVIALDPGDRRAAFAAVQLTRRTGDRYRDVGAEARQEVVDWLRSGAAPASYLRLVEEGGELDLTAQTAAFGESLPAGIRLL